MSSDRSAVALERFDVAADEGGPSAAAPACDLAELASALGRVEALITAGTAESVDVSAAVERIADIAFVLHEREVEPSLCDALDAAMRDINAANARNRANVAHAHEAAELLRSLARRLDAMMAAQAEAPASAATAIAAASGLQPLANSDEREGAAEDELPPPGRLFDADLAEDKAFAETVAALAQALPEHGEAAPAQSQPQPEELMSGAGEATTMHASIPEAPVAASVAHVWPAAVEAVASLASSAEIVAPPAVETHQAIDPDEDPGDLFEPMPGVRPAVGIADGQPAYAAPRPPANDPLAPIRALSEEELIALFS